MTDYPLSEIAFRKYAHPGGLKGRDLSRMICLSLGILQSDDSRDVIVDVLHSLILEGQLTSAEIESKVLDIRKNHKLPLSGVSTPNIRRQIRRLKSLGLVEKHDGTYRFRNGLSIHDAFTNHVIPEHVDDIIQRVKQYLKEVGNV